LARPAEGDPEEAILGPKSSALVGPEVDGKLLAQSGVLKSKAPPVASGCRKAERRATMNVRMAREVATRREVTSQTGVPPRCAGPDGLFAEYEDVL